MNTYSKEDLTAHLRELGVNEGDTLFVRATLQKLGKIEAPFKKTIMDALLEAVGPEGTLLTLGFTKSFFLGIGADKPEHIYTQDTMPETGALGKLFHAHPQCKRSTHPTNSYLAIGKNAQVLTENHNENSLSYDPMGTLIELKGKMLLLGCLQDSPGFTTVHYVQQKLGLTKRSILCNLLKVYFNKDGKKTLFKRVDIGGCSAGFKRLYIDYLEQNILKSGKIGNASSLLIGAPEAYEIEYKRLQENNKYFMCENPLCTSCRMTWWFSLSSMPKFVVQKTFHIIKSRLTSANKPKS